MNIDITKLKSGYESNIDFNFTYSFSKEQLENTGILKLDDIKISGYITEEYEDYHINALIEGTMILPCAITLEEVSYPISIKIDDNFGEFFENEEKNCKRCENSIDIFPIIWENILMEIPMRVVSENAKNIHLEGNGWKLITDEEEVKSNSPFEKLNDLLK